MHGTVVALEQHLGNTGRTSEVAVYLKRRMRVKKIGIRTVWRHGHTGFQYS